MPRLPQPVTVTSIKREAFTRAPDGKVGLVEQIVHMVSLGGELSIELRQVLPEHHEYRIGEQFVIGLFNDAQRQ
jgi:hypothetical protein